ANRAGAPIARMLRRTRVMDARPPRGAARSCPPPDPASSRPGCLASQPGPRRNVPRPVAQPAARPPSGSAAPGSAGRRPPHGGWRRTQTLPGPARRTIPPAFRATVCPHRAPVARRPRASLDPRRSGRELRAALRPAAGDDGPAGSSAHAHAEPVTLGASAVVRLIRALAHRRSPFGWEARKYTGARRRRTKPLTTERASRPRARLPVWKNPVLSSAGSSPRIGPPTAGDLPHMVFHGCGKVLWKRMPVAYSEHDAREAWSHVVDHARRELPEPTIAMWFADVRATGMREGALELSVPSALVRDHLQRNHLGMIEEAAAEAVGEPVKIELRVDEALRSDVERMAEPAQSRSMPDKPALGAPGLPFPNYTFDAFVPGPSNRFAHAAAMAVAEAPMSTAYNPLFVYGGTGLGKTHLLVAIGHHMHRLDPRISVKYVTTEHFVTDFIKALRERQTDQFRRR